MRLMDFCLGFVAFAIACVPASGAENNAAPSPAFKEFVQQARLQGSQPTNYYGYHLELSQDGNVMAVGAYGSVYVYTRVGTTWTQQARLESKAGAAEYFGIAVALSADGTTLAVGAHFAVGPDGAYGAGKAYVYTYSDGKWTEQAQLYASDAAEQGHMGVVVLSPDGNTLAVGAYAPDPVRNQAGKVYVFTRTDGVWTQQAQFQANDAAGRDCFGINVALSFDSNTIAVTGYCARDFDGTETGLAWVFVRSDGVWTQQARLQASNPAPGGRFGTRVALSADGDTLATSADFAYNSAGVRGGNAYVFTRSGGVWTEQSRLHASNAAEGGRFGSNVGLTADGNTLVVGAYGDAHSGVDAGSAYVFTRSGDLWTERSRLQAADAAAGDYFGIRVKVTPDGSTLAVGAYGVDHSGVVDAGRVYVFVSE